MILGPIKPQMHGPVVLPSRRCPQLTRRKLQVAESEKHDGARAFDERGAATYMQQILGAMSYLHKNNFVHRETWTRQFVSFERGSWPYY